MKTNVTIKKLYQDRQTWRWLSRGSGWGTACLPWFMGLHLRSLCSLQIPRGLDWQKWRSASPAASQESLTSPRQAGSWLAPAADVPHSLPLLLFRPAGPQGSAALFSALSWSLAWLC